MNALNRVLGGVGEPCSEKIANYQPPTLIESLKLRQKSLKEQLKNVENAIEAIETNPAVTRVLELLGKANL